MAEGYVVILANLAQMCHKSLASCFRSVSFDHNKSAEILTFYTKDVISNANVVKTQNIAGGNNYKYLRICTVAGKKSKISGDFVRVQYLQKVDRHVVRCTQNSDIKQFVCRIIWFYRSYQTN